VEAAVAVCVMTYTTLRVYACYAYSVVSYRVRGSTVLNVLSEFIGP